MGEVGGREEARTGDQPLLIPHDDGRRDLDLLGHIPTHLKLPDRTLNASYLEIEPTVTSSYNISELLDILKVRKIPSDVFRKLTLSRIF